MRKIFLDDLPRYKDGTYKGKINWKDCINYEIKGIYENKKFRIKILDYETTNQTLIIKYNNKNFKIKTSGLINCKLGKILGEITSEFKIEIGTRFQDDKRDIIITDREIRNKKKSNNSIVKEKWYKYYCNICTYEEGWIEESHLLGNKSGGCSCCRGFAVVQGINDIPTVAPWMVKYFVGGYEEAKLYTYGSKSRKKFICPDCGEIKNKSIVINNLYMNKSIGCSCSDGQKFPNKFAFDILKQLNIDFETEYNPKWIKPKRYDFYFKLDNKEYIIEMDGGWHNIDNNMSGQTADESKAIDNYKDRLAIEYGIEVIRINCDYDKPEERYEYIKQNILESNLEKLFDLSKVDWLQAEEFALNNLVKIICEYKNNNPNMSTKEIALKFHIGRTSVHRYLTKGLKRKWCKYNPQEEIRINIINNNKLKRKSVVILKNNISLSVFESVTDIERQSEKLFGVKLNHTNISKVCNNKKPQYKGYKFKYISDLTPEEYIKYDIENELIELHNKELV